MANKSKQKGNRFERECLKIAKDCGLEGTRAWGSNGQALGLPEDVDLLIAGLPFQCKVRHKIAKYLIPSKNNYAQIIKEDYGKVYAVLPFKELLKLIKETNNDKRTHAPP